MQSVRVHLVGEFGFLGLVEKGLVMKLEICNTNYVKSHGRNPSGFGSWAFDLSDSSDRTYTKTVFAPASTLGDAKKWLRKWVNENMAAELATGCLSASVAS
jgi:hypothetical protein